MLTDALLQNSDTPWRRLRWTLPVSLLLWILALWSLAYFMEKPTHRPLAEPPIDAQFIELPEAETHPEPPVIAPKPTVKHESPQIKEIVKPVEKAATPAPLAAPVAVPVPVVPKAIPAKEETLIAPRPTPMPETATPAKEEHPSRPTPLSEAATPAKEEHPPRPTPLPEAVTPTPAREGAQTPVAPQAPPAPAPAPSASGQGAGSAVVNSGAHAIVRPMPQIPDDLREEAFNSVAVARFHIGADGGATVELARPTQNPRLNRILLDTLKNWKFFPAIKDGKPIASAEEIVIKIRVD